MVFASYNCISSKILLCIDSTRFLSLPSLISLQPILVHLRYETLRKPCKLYVPISPINFWSSLSHRQFEKQLTFLTIVLDINSFIYKTYLTPKALVSLRENILISTNIMIEIGLFIVWLNNLFTFLIPDHMVFGTL